MNTRVAFSFIIISSVVLLFSGCKKEGLQTEYVTGVVKVDGVPVKDVTLTFIPKDPGSIESASAITIEGGEYKLTSVSGRAEEGAVAGDYIVTATWPDMTPIQIDEENFVPNGKELLPREYQDKEKTPLSATVVKGKNKIDFELKTK